MASRLGIEVSHIEMRPRFNVAPSQPVLVARAVQGGVRELLPLKWGLVPFWSREPRTPYSTINARAGTVDSKPAFREPFRKRRCIIPADGWYEWQQSAGGKQPWYISAADGNGFAFAGLWDTWQARDGDDRLETCSIIVTTANDATRAIHDRMPVILNGQAMDVWLSPTAAPQDLKELLGPCEPALVRAWTVSTRVNSPRNDSPECTAPT